MTQLTNTNIKSLILKVTFEHTFHDKVKAQKLNVERSERMLFTTPVAYKHTLYIFPSPLFIKCFINNCFTYMNIKVNHQRMWYFTLLGCCKSVANIYEVSYICIMTNISLLLRTTRCTTDLGPRPPTTVHKVIYSTLRKYWMFLPVAQNGI